MSYQKKSAFLRASVALALSSSAWVVPTAALAQSESTTSLEEIVVTAQRRVEKLQEVPISVSAMSGDDLAKQGIERFSDLERATPSLTVSDGPGGRFLNIRGIGIGVSTPFQTAGVPLHIDGLYIPRAEFFLRDAYFDIERVEVYRGPQGTFAGQNSTGGALFVNAKQPDFNKEVDFGIEQTIGSFHRYETEAYANLPISDTWAARISVTDRSRDGYAVHHGPGTTQLQSTTTCTTLTVNGACTTANATTPPSTTVAPIFGYGNSNNIDGNATIGTENRRSIRGILRYMPSENLDVRLRYDYMKVQGNGEANARARPNSFNNPDTVLSPYDYYSDFAGWDDTQVHRGILNIAWQFTDGLLLKSVSGYQRLTSDTGADTDGTSPYVVIDPSIDWNPAAPANLPGTVAPDPSHRYPGQGWGIARTIDDYYYQEFDLVSTSDGPLKWVVGINGLTQQSLFNNNNGAYQAQVFTTSSVAGASTTTTTLILPPNPNYLNGTPTPGSWLDYHQTHYSYAGFGDVTLSLGDQFELKSGARYTFDHIELEKGSTVRSSATGQLSACGTALCNVFGTAEAKKVTGMAAINWFPFGDRSKTLYASISRGMKPGGYLTQFTLQAQSPDPNGFPGSRPETLRNYELGFKMSTSWLQASASVYYQDYRDYQAQFRIPGQAIPRAQNIPETQGKGAELQLRTAIGGFGSTLNVGYHESEIQASNLLPIVAAGTYANNCPLYTGAGPASTATPPPAGLATCPSYTPPLVFGASGATNSYFIDPTGMPLNFDPELTYNISMDYTFQLDDNSSLTPFVQYSFVDEQWAQLTHASQDFIPSRKVADARLVYKTGDHWRLEGYVTNVLDERYVAGIAGGPTATPFYASVALGAPREYGVKVQFKY